MRSKKKFKRKFSDIPNLEKDLRAIFKGPVKLTPVQAYVQARGM